MFEPVLSGPNTNMGATGTPAIPENNSLNYLAASSTASPIHEPLPKETPTPAPARAKANECPLV